MDAETHRLPLIQLLLLVLCSCRFVDSANISLSQSAADECQELVTETSLLYDMEIQSDGCRISCTVIVKSPAYDFMYFDESETTVRVKDGIACLDEDHVSSFTFRLM